MRLLLVAGFVFGDNQPTGLSLISQYLTTTLGSWGGPRRGPTTSPKHYLFQFHPDYTEMSEIEGMMSEGSFDNWMDLFGQKNGSVNIDKPSLAA